MESVTGSSTRQGGQPLRFGGPNISERDNQRHGFSRTGLETQRDIDVGKLVLDCLERPDRSAELLALQRVAHRHVEHRLSEPDQLRRRCHYRLIVAIRVQPCTGK